MRSCPYARLVKSLTKEVNTIARKQDASTKTSTIVMNAKIPISLFINMPLTRHKKLSIKIETPGFNLCCAHSSFKSRSMENSFQRRNYCDTLKLFDQGKRAR